jgi:hypothetical protein
LQSTTNAVEGGCVFKLINSDNWILMYDMYTSGAYQFTQSTDLVNFSVASTPVSFDFTPRHGTIIPLTPTELNALNVKWNPSAVGVRTPSVKFGFYPNPASDFITVETEGSADARLEIYDLPGRRVLARTLDSAKEEINLNGLTSGVYLLRYYQDKKLVASRRFLIE